MSKKLSKLAGAAAALALCFVSTSAVARSAPSSKAPAAMNPWVALSSFDSAAAAAMAAQPGDNDDDSNLGKPPILVLGVILATIAIGTWIVLKDKDKDKAEVPASPN
jgi:hypothetical protein